MNGQWLTESGSPAGRLAIGLLGLVERVEPTDVAAVGPSLFLLGMQIGVHHPDYARAWVAYVARVGGGYSARLAEGLMADITIAELEA